MRVLMIARLPHESFNAMVRKGEAGKRLKSILDFQKPESVYFVETNGKRTAILVVNLKDASGIPALAEPWFLSFNADVEFHPAMTPEDLASSGLDKLGSDWA